MNDDFITYSEIEECIDSIEGFTYEYSNNELRVFYDFGKNQKYKQEIPIRQPLFNVNLNNAFSIIAPYGYRLTQAKEMSGFNEIEKKVIDLSRTPIHKRGTIKKER